MKELVYIYLDNAMYIGIKENEFWEMTIAEVARAIKTYNKVRIDEQKEKASYDYILSQMIASGIASILDGRNKTPSIEEIYPTLFTDNKEKQDKRQEALMELSALRFKQFAKSYNSKFTGGGKNSE